MTEFRAPKEEVVEWMRQLLGSAEMTDVSATPSRITFTLGTLVGDVEVSMSGEAIVTLMNAHSDA